MTQAEEQSPNRLGFVKAVNGIQAPRFDGDDAEPMFRGIGFLASTTLVRGDRWETSYLENYLGELNHHLAYAWRPRLEAIRDILSTFANGFSASNVPAGLKPQIVLFLSAIEVDNTVALMAMREALVEEYQAAFGTYTNENYLLGLHDVVFATQESVSVSDYFNYKMIPHLTEEREADSVAYRALKELGRVSPKLEGTPFRVGGSLTSSDIAGAIDASGAEVTEALSKFHRQEQVQGIRTLVDRPPSDASDEEVRAAWEDDTRCDVLWTLRAGGGPLIDIIEALDAGKHPFSSLRKGIVERDEPAALPSRALVQAYGLT